MANWIQGWANKRFAGDMMAGRKPKPTAIKIAEGNPGGRKLRTDEPQPTPGLPDAPSGLTPRAIEVWERLIPELDAMGVVARVHADLIASYCRAVAEEEWAEATIAEEGAIITTQSGTWAHPAVKLRNEAEKRKRHIAVEFGITPSSQSRASKVTTKKGSNGEPENDALRLYLRANKTKTG